MVPRIVNFARFPVCMGWFSVAFALLKPRVIDVTDKMAANGERFAEDRDEERIHRVYNNNRETRTEGEAWCV